MNKLVPILASAFLLGCNARSSQTGALDGGMDSGLDASSDTESDEDTSSNTDDTGEDTASDASLPCDAACEDGEWNECTCDPSDPCNWSGDGQCAGQCIELGIVDKMFDDSEDCEGPCTGMCQRGVYVTCTCALTDPCGWAGDGHCDDACLAGEIVDEMFNDTKDCGDAGTV
ncbi:MAG: hypothetical protein GY854_02740 [Deltaproteobacteria bacterium]|nr:hypothetical protein [Deltaproteobacteria bacterium]